jgi:hypothetical protein
MKKGDLVRDLRMNHIGFVTDTYVHPQLNKLFVKIFSVGRETGWLVQEEVELVKPLQDEVE